MRFGADLKIDVEADNREDATELIASLIEAATSFAKHLEENGYGENLAVINVTGIHHIDD